MKDEIKEMNFSEMLFNRDERLLDYITNLQNGFKSTVEELCETTEKLEKTRKHLKETNRGLAKVMKRRTIYRHRCINLKHKMKELQQENERLKMNKINDYMSKDNTYYREAMIYRSRCDKAIEYLNTLKNYRFEFTFNSVDRHEIVGCEKNFVKDLLNILNGGDKDVKN